MVTRVEVECPLVAIVDHDQREPAVEIWRRIERDNSLVLGLGSLVVVGLDLVVVEGL